MDDYREQHKQRWIDEQGKAADAANGNGAPASSSSAPPPDENGGNSTGSADVPSVTGSSSQEVILERLHILPFAEAERQLAGKSRIDWLAPELRKRRQSQESVKTGDVIVAEGLEFAIIRAEPDEGFLGPNTDYFIDGTPLVSFEKVQFIASGPEEMSSEALFSTCVAPFFKGSYAPYGTPGACRVRILHSNQVIQLGDIVLHVEATEPAGMGVVTNQTEIFTNWDPTPEFEKIHIVPFQDTLPRAYEFDIFGDYLKPYLLANPHKKFSGNEMFTYHGVQFKVVCCEPEGNKRIGKSTTIYCEGVLHPSLRNLLPPELLMQVAQLPPGLQMLLLNTERSTRELEEMLNHRRGLFEETLNEIETFDWPPPAGSAPCTQTTCVVCQMDFIDGEPCRRLPCRHVFHTGCVDEWLRRCTDCPVCKDNVDRAIRNY